MGKLLSQATCDATDLNVTFFPSYGAAMRGGTSNCYVVISDEKYRRAGRDTVDDLVVMNGPSLQVRGDLKAGGTLFINSSIVKDKIEMISRWCRLLSRRWPSRWATRERSISCARVYIGYTKAVGKRHPERDQHKFEKSKLIPLNVERSTRARIAKPGEITIIYFIIST